MKIVLLSVVTLLTTSVAQAQTALYLSIPSVSDATLSSWDAEVSSVFSSAGCEIHRSGKIGGALGPLAWPELDTFRLYQCNESVLTALVEAGVTDKLTSGSRQPVLVEGDLVTMDAPIPTVTAEYIIKVSYYSDTDGTLRDKDLVALNTKVSSKKGVWHTEGVLIPSKTVGTIRPDELTFLFYDSSDIANKFRDEHPEILEMIGQFNGAHLTSFLYLGATISEN
jgi:hypothetical protein